MSQFGYYLYVSMALSEEPQVASEVQRMSPARAKSLMGDSWIDKAPRAQTLERLCFIYALYCLLFLSFSGI